MIKFISEIKTFIEKKSLLSTGDKILVTLSGGADSVSLLLALLELGYDCVAVHCNFHLRGAESMRDQKFTEDLCNVLGVRLIIRDFDTLTYSKENGVSIEMAARTLRYNAFEEIRLENNLDYIAVAHHIDDSVETVIMNLIRGTGIRGLTGIKSKNGNIVRPLLCVSKFDILEYLESKNQGFITDSTNLKNDFTRNKIRLDILPLMKEINPSVSQAVMNTSFRLQQVFEVYADAIKGGMDRVLTTDGEVCRIDIEKLKSEPSAESLLFEILFPLGFNDSQVDDVYKSINADSGKNFASSTHVVLKDRGFFLIMKKEAFDQVTDNMEIRVEDGLSFLMPDGRKLSMRIKDSDFEISKNPNVVTIDADKAGDVLMLRHVMEGDVFIPFGMKGKKLLSDYMTDKKLSILQKRDQMVICNRDAIVWVMGHRIDQRFAVTHSTRRVLILTISR